MGTYLRSIVCIKMFVLVSLVLIPAMAIPAFAICFDSTLLASYEPVEVNDLTVTTDAIKDPCLIVTWPLCNGVNEIPPPTDGDCVLRLDFNEPDHKIEIGYYWDNFTFDLAGSDFIHADVLIEPESAIPEIMGIWDNLWSYQWVSADCVPRWPGEWYTISYGVAALNDVDVNHMEALVFENMPAVSGTIYLDNLRLGPAEFNCYRKIKFSEHWWSVLWSDWPMGAGPNRYTDSPNDIWIDPNGYLHLSIVHRDANWYCSEAIANENLGYGTYVFTVEGRTEPQDPNIILGLFIYDVPEDSNHREIDVEISRWGDVCEPNNAQFVVQPWNEPNHVYRFPIDEHRTITYEISWLADQIDFRGYYGAPPLGDPDNLIASWTYTGDDIPEPGCENPRINFYLKDGKPPANGQDAEVVIKSFHYLPNISAYIDVEPEIFNLAKKNRWLTCNIRLGEDYDVGDIDPRCVLLEERVKAERIWFNRRKQVARIRFDGSEVQEMLAERSELGDVELMVRGQLTDGTRFKGKDTIRVIDKSGKK